MKKIFWICLLLVIMGGAAFFLGWAQLRVPPGSYGVMRSKTHGTDPRIIREGEFRWVWYKLIPTNVAILVFSPNVVNHPIELRGSLPSGDIYAGFAGLDADFSYEIAGTLSFNIRADALPDLAAREGLTDQAGLEALEQRLAGEISLHLSRGYGDGETGSGELLEGEIPEWLGREIAAAYPAVENVVCAVRNIRYPDRALYGSLRSLYEAYIEGQHRALAAAAGVQAEQHIAAQIRFDELARYGELLTKYPILLQYLALEKNVDTPVSPGKE
jgi:hypothetical protein